MTEECKCMFCEQPFKPGDKLQAFLRSPDDPIGSWTDSVTVDEGFQKRHQRNLASQGNFNPKRRHEDCGPQTIEHYACVRCDEHIDCRDDNFVCESNGTGHHPEFGTYHWWEGEITCENCELKQPYGDQSI